MPKSKSPEEEDKPQPRIEVTKVSPKEGEKKAEKDAAATTPRPNEEEVTGQATILMQAPSTFEQLVEKILKKHKI